MILTVLAVDKFPFKVGEKVCLRTEDKQIVIFGEHGTGCQPVLQPRVSFVADGMATTINLIGKTETSRGNLVAGFITLQ